jgi:hypothetical protein
MLTLLNESRITIVEWWTDTDQSLLTKFRSRDDNKQLYKEASFRNVEFCYETIDWLLDKKDSTERI